MSPRSKIRIKTEAAASRFLLKLIRLLPRRAILALAWTGGNIGVLLDRRGRKIGLANLDVAFGDSKTAKEKKQILRQSFVTFVRTTLDVFWFGNRPGKLRRYVELDDSMQILFQEKNQICITAHFGNWEVVGQSMAMKGFPFSSIAMPLKNPAVDRILVEQREITGQKIIQREGALRKLLGVLRAGGKTAFLVDQNTEVKDGGIWVTYFGLPVLSTPAPAALAAKTGSELITGFCIPLPRGKYRVYVADVRPAPENSDSATIQNITQKILTVIENEVRKAPHHWLWAYKRWKTVLRPEDLPHYPFYAEYDPKDL